VRGGMKRPAGDFRERRESLKEAGQESEKTTRAV
jgi:hypothetical protein